jgi:hypothetical protein
LVVVRDNAFAGVCCDGALTFGLVVVEPLALTTGRVDFASVFKVGLALG